MFGECFYDGSGMEPTAYFVHSVDEHSGGFECCECDKEIEEAEMFELVTANYEGDWRVYATCVTCERIRNSLYKSGDFVHGGLWKAIKDRYGLTPDGIDEDWTPPDRRASGVEIADSYEAELEDLENLPPDFMYKSPEELRLILGTGRKPVTQ